MVILEKRGTMSTINDRKRWNSVRKCKGELSDERLVAELGGDSQKKTTTSKITDRKRRNSVRKCNGELSDARLVAELGGDSKKKNEF